MDESLADKPMTWQDWSALRNCTMALHARIVAAHGANHETAQALLMLADKCELRMYAATEGRCVP
jgi:hypothetical protein